MAKHFGEMSGYIQILCEDEEELRRVMDALLAKQIGFRVGPRTNTLYLYVSSLDGSDMDLTQLRGQLSVVEEFSQQISERQGDRELLARDEATRH